MTAVDELTELTPAEEPLPPLLEFLIGAGFPEELRRKVDLATKRRTPLRESTDFPGLLQALRETRRPRLLELTTDLRRAVTAAVQRYPINMQGPIEGLLLRQQSPSCPAWVYYLVLATPMAGPNRVDVEPLLDALIHSSDYREVGIILKACPR